MRDALRNVQLNMLMPSTQPIITCKDCGYVGGIYLKKTKK